MLKPITCPACKGALARFNEYTGCIFDDRIPDGMRVWGMLIRCAGCGRTTRWNGAQIAAQMKRKRNADDIKVVAKRN